jgi:hypothetical protein
MTELTLHSDTSLVGTCTHELQEYLDLDSDGFACESVKLERRRQTVTPSQRLNNSLGALQFQTA